MPQADIAGHVGDFDVSGWVPQWLPALDQLEVQRDSLLACSQHWIIDSWLVWNLELDERFAELPVILSLDDGRPRGVLAEVRRPVDHLEHYRRLDSARRLGDVATGLAIARPLSASSVADL